MTRAVSALQVKVVLLCSTQRGRVFLLRLADLLPHAEIIVFSFPEDPWEPPYFDDLREACRQVNAAFHESKHVSASELFEAAGGVDLILAVNWRYIVAPDAVALARLGAYVFHDSLLPSYRGFAPTVWALVNGERETGVTLLTMAPEYDRGLVVGQARLEIGDDDSIADLLPRVTSAYLDLLDRHLPALLEGSPPMSAQDEARASYTVKLTPLDMRIDWSWPTARILNLIRALTRPYPGATTTMSGQILRVWSARPLGASKYVGGRPGRVVEVRPGAGSVVLTGDGAILLVEVERPTDGPLPAHAVLRSITTCLGA